MIVPFHRRRIAATVCAGAFVLAAVTGCGSAEETASDPDQTPAAATSPQASPDAGSTIDVTAVPVPGATAGDDATADGVAPASVTISSPEDGHQVGNTLSVSGMANSPEGNVPWQIDSPTDGILVSGFATAEGSIDKAYPWTAKIDVGALQPGTYTFTARVDDDSKNEGTKPPSATISFVKD